MNIKSKVEEPNLWNAEAEALIALLSNIVSQIRPELGKDNKQICRQLNYELLRKRDAKNDKNYGPTGLQRVILNKTGY